LQNGAAYASHSKLPQTRQREKHLGCVSILALKLLSHADNPPGADLYASALQLCVAFGRASCAAWNLYSEQCENVGAAIIMVVERSLQNNNSSLTLSASLKNTRELILPLHWLRWQEFGALVRNLCKILLLWPNFKFCAPTTISGYFCWWESEARTPTRKHTHALFINALSPHHPTTNAYQKDEQMREEGINLGRYVGQCGALATPHWRQTGKLRFHTLISNDEFLPAIVSSVNVWGALNVFGARIKNKVLNWRRPQRRK
jgi:hypothetical protein